MRFARVCDQNGRIAGTARADFAADGLADGSFCSVNYFKNRMALAGAEIQSYRITALFKVLQSTDVRVCQVTDVDVVAEAGAVGCGVVVAEDLELRAMRSCRQ